MIKEFKAFFDLFQQGKQLTNSATWKNRQTATNAMGVVLSAGFVIAGGFGYVVPIDDATLSAAAAGIVALYGVFNSVLTTITSAKVGLPPKPDNSGE